MRTLVRRNLDPKKNAARRKFRMAPGSSRAVLTALAVGALPLLAVALPLDPVLTPPGASASIAPSASALRSSPSRSVLSAKDVSLQRLSGGSTAVQVVQPQYHILTKCLFQGKMLGHWILHRRLPSDLGATGGQPRSSPSWRHFADRQF